jgi:hypothetical protein
VPRGIECGAAIDAEACSRRAGVSLPLDSVTTRRPNDSDDRPGAADQMGIDVADDALPRMRKLMELVETASADDARSGATTSEKVPAATVSNSDDRRAPRPIEHICDRADIRKCPCTRARRAEWKRDRRRKDPDAESRRVRRDNLQRAYGISVDDYDALRAAQVYRCAICQRHEDELPVVSSGRPRLDGSPPATAVTLVVDHCHRGGGNRALLCQGCNIGLGGFEDEPERLESAAAYLRRFRR